jgi:hypothetical protein
MQRRALIDCNLKLTTYLAATLFLTRESKALGTNSLL